MTVVQDVENKSDEEIVSLAIHNPDYFYFLVKRYESKILRYITRISGLSKIDGEDLLQEVFLSVYKNLNDFDKSLKFSSWIYRIARNKVIDNWRKIESRPKLVYSLEKEIFENFVSDINMANDLNKEYENKIISEVLAKLDEKYREVLILKFLEEKSYEEISDILKKPMGTVATLINRAKKNFKEEAIKSGVRFN